MTLNVSIKPNHVTFRGVLCACSHAGIVEERHEYFEEMEHVYKIKSAIARCGAMVDILGRAGCPKEAYDFIINLPVEADGVLLGTLLTACDIHDVNDYFGVGEKVRQRLIELEPKREMETLLSTITMKLDFG